MGEINIQYLSIFAHDISEPQSQYPWKVVVWHSVFKACSPNIWFTQLWIMDTKETHTETKMTEI